MMRICIAALLIGLPFASSAQEGPVYGAELEGFEYPYPVKYYEFQSQAKALRMAYLDVAPEGTANGRTAG